MAIEKTIEALVADYTRQGGHLDIDQVNRILERRGLNGSDGARVMHALAGHGVRVEGVEPSTLGYERTLPLGTTRAGRTGVVDSLDLFLDEIGRFRLLTADDEVRLGRRIERGRQALSELASAFGPEIAPETDGVGQLARPFCRLQELIDGGRQVVEADACLVKQALDGRSALLHLVVANIRLVVNHARAAGHRSNLDTLDLMQEGILGLLRAAEKYDCSQGYKFSTYATWWIRQAISRALANQGSAIRLPVRVHTQKATVDRVRRSLGSELGRNASLVEIAVQLGWDIAEVEAIEGLAALQPISLECSIGEDDRLTVADLITGRHSEDPADIMVRQEFARDIKSMLTGLGDREHTILKRRYGIDTGVIETLEEIGDDLGLSRERIRQIEKKALARLGSQQDSSHLWEYIESA